MKINRREAVLAWCTLVFVVLGGTWWLGQPALQEWRDFSRDSEALQRRKRIAARLMEEQPQIEVRLTELRKKLPLYPANRDVTAEMLRILERTARDTSLGLTRRDPQAEKSTGELFELAIVCQWEAELEALARFLYALQQQDAILDIRKLTVNPVPGQPGRLKGSFTLDCAYSREAAAAEPAQPAPPGS
ncbi:MAG: type 4a pilus biogenesis protein PilO [Kiritimatiellae bacterium]|nr:type 4a pilus biogenesis protein PilO [Kiritimatiellia bacterium]